MTKVMTKKEKRAICSILVKAQKLITPYERWTTRDMARTVTGLSVQPRHRSAVSFCVAGAIDKVCSKWAHADSAQRFIDEFCGKKHRRRLTAFNDIRYDRKNHARVLALFDAALEELKS